MITVSELINKKLDEAYRKSAGPMLKQIQQMSTVPNSEIQRALLELEIEADSLIEQDKKMTGDNPRLKRALVVYAALLTATQTLIMANDDIIQQTGTLLGPPGMTARVFLARSMELIEAGIDPIDNVSELTNALRAAGIPWNFPSPRTLTVRKAANFVQSLAWKKRMEKWGAGYAKLTERTILNGIFKGLNPREIANLMRRSAENIPLHAADNLMKTLQFNAYREASLAMELLNGKFIKKKIRVAQLDNRTCLSCIALHGSEVPLGQKVDDHYRGRCTEYYVVEGGPPHPEFMQADSTPGNRRFVRWQTGPQWFSSLPLERQKLQNSFAKSPGKWDLYRSGTPLSSFVVKHTDDVFGPQVLEGTIKSIIGDT